MPTDTFPVASDADDGDGSRSAATWATVSAGSFTPGDGTEGSVVQSLFTGTYFLGNIYLRFDTSALPDDATITAGNVLLHVTDRASPDSKQFAGDYYDFGGEPSVAADWEATSSGDAISAFTVASLTIGAVNTIPLTGLAGISKTGVTGIRLAPLDAVEPTGDNFATFAMREHLTAQEPRLEVTYTTGAAADTTTRRYQIRRSRMTSW